jgi:indolepyruvate ferredoxin oxidoreductase
MAAEGVARIMRGVRGPVEYGRRSGCHWLTRVWGGTKLAEAERTLAAGARRHRPRLRPGLRGGTAPAAQTRPRPERTQRVVINEAVCEGCGVLRGEEQLPVSPAGGHRAWPQDADRPVLLQHRLQLPGRRLPLVRDRAVPAAQRGQAAAAARPARGSAPSQRARPPSRPRAGTRWVATGIGGTGVVMLNQVLATAAFLDGLGVTGPRPDRAQPEGTGRVPPAAVARRPGPGGRPAERPRSAPGGVQRGRRGVGRPAAGPWTCWSRRSPGTCPGSARTAR